MKQAVKAAAMVAAMVSLSAGWKTPCRADAPTPVTLALSSVAMEFDDGLDVRDAMGRPVRSEIARREFKQLFVSTVYSLLTRPEMPQMAEFLAALNKTWDLLRAALARPLVKAWQGILALGLPTSRKGTAPPLLAILTAAFSALVLFRFGSPDNASGSKPFLACLSSVVIRC